MGYECVYKTTVPKLIGVDFMLCRHLYEIVSPKTNVYYMVWVEEYEDHFFAIKFHQRKDKKNPNKYSILTGNNEARPIINSCLVLLVQFAKRYTDSSFGFIGAGMVDDDSMENTKRFRVYRKIVSTLISEKHFEHRFLPKKSTYILLRKTTLQAKPNLPDVLYDKFSFVYSYFD